MLANAFRDKDPDGNGQADTFGMALQAAKPRDLIHMLDLFIFGSGLRHTLIDPEGKITIDQPAHAQVLEEFLKTYSTYKFVAPDTINHSFAEMYQVIEGGRGGMFRVGDWNVRKWDGAQVLNGDFVSGPWPKFAADRPKSVVIGGMRGVAIPENSPNKALAQEFAAFMLSKAAQQASLENIGAGVRKDLDVSKLSPRSQYFAKAEHRLVPMISRNQSTPSIRSLRPPSIASCSRALRSRSGLEGLHRGDRKGNARPRGEAEG